MKTFITILASISFLFFSLTSLSAQEEMKAKKYDNPQWQRIVYTDYHSGKTGKALGIIENYYRKAGQLAGTPGPSTFLRMQTGQYDVIMIWDMPEGLETMNWDISPNNVKWRNALNEVAGSTEKADEILAEYQSCVRSGKMELARKIR